MKHKTNPVQIRPIDFVPALSGLIGKTALVTSFAVVWAKQLNITTPDFVFENVRIELLIGSIITLIVALLYKDTAPSGSLAPFIVLVPAMAGFGVHPFPLSVLIGLFGYLSIRTGLFHKLVSLSGPVTKTGITLTIGISGVMMSLKNLRDYFGGITSPLVLMTGLLLLLFLVLLRYKKNWLIIPVSAAIALLLPPLFGMRLELSAVYSLPSLNPSYWWNTMWGIGYGMDYNTLARTVPFALFAIVLWAVDTVSIQTMIEANSKPGDQREDIHLNRSFIVSSIRNLLGGIFGGAQTSALWRSYLIPLFMIKRPMRASSILMGALGITAGLLAVPVKILSYPPLIWFVLLFGIFLPFVLVGVRNALKSDKVLIILLILCLTLAGVIISPIVTWICAVLCDKLLFRKNHK